MVKLAADINVEVIQAWPDRACSIQLRLAPDTTVGQALGRPEVLALFPQALTQEVGIYGQVCGHLRRLRDGDRIELYRPLLIDPKDARRERAKRG